MQQNSDQLKVAISQIAPVWLDKEKTLLKIKEQVEKAGEEGCQLIVFGRRSCRAILFGLN